MKGEKEKILLKLCNSTNIYGRCEWRHLCYVDKAIFSKFLAANKYTMADMNKVIIDWCKEDFNKTIKLNTRQNIVELKEIIKGYYKDKYPDLYRDSSTDRQGWVRVWIMDHMKEAING